MYTYTPTTITDPSRFVGRTEQIQTILSFIAGEVGGALLIAGPRRIGKTSLLIYVEKTLEPDARAQTLFLDLTSLEIYGDDDVGAGVTEVCRRFAVGCGAAAPAQPSRREALAFFTDTLKRWSPDRRLVILLDELSSRPTSEAEAADARSRRDMEDETLSFLNQLRRHHPAWVRVVMAAGRDISEAFDPLRRGDIKDAIVLPITLFQAEQTRELALKSDVREGGPLEWREEGVDRVHTLTAGHPYLIHLLCFQVWQRAADRGDPLIDAQAVEAIRDTAIDAGEAGLDWIWSGLPPAGRLVSMAAAQRGGLRADDVFQALVKVFHRHLSQEGWMVRGDGWMLKATPRSLEAWDILIRRGDRYRFRIPMFERWITRHQRPAELASAFRELDPTADATFVAALEREGLDPLPQSLSQLSSIIAANPCHGAARHLAARCCEAHGRPAAGRFLLEVEPVDAGVTPRRDRALRLAEQGCLTADDEAARTLLDQARALDHSLRGLRPLIDELRQRAAGRRARDAVERAEERVRQADFVGALRLVESIQEDAPDELRDRLERARESAAGEAAVALRRSVQSSEREDKRGAREDLERVIAVRSHLEQGLADEALLHLYFASTGRDVVRLLDADHRRELERRSPSSSFTDDYTLGVLGLFDPRSPTDVATLQRLGEALLTLYFKTGGRLSLELFCANIVPGGRQDVAHVVRARLDDRLEATDPDPGGDWGGLTRPNFLNLSDLSSSRHRSIQAILALGDDPSFKGARKTMTRRGKPWIAIPTEALGEATGSGWWWEARGDASHPASQALSAWLLRQLDAPQPPDDDDAQDHWRKIIYKSARSAVLFQPRPTGNYKRILGGWAAGVLLSVLAISAAWSLHIQPTHVDELAAAQSAGDAARAETALWKQLQLTPIVDATAAGMGLPPPVDEELEQWVDELRSAITYPTPSTRFPHESYRFEQYVVRGHRADDARTRTVKLVVITPRRPVSPDDTPDTFAIASGFTNFARDDTPSTVCLALGQPADANQEPPRKGVCNIRKLDSNVVDATCPGSTWRETLVRGGVGATAVIHPEQIACMSLYDGEPRSLESFRLIPNPYQDPDYRVYQGLIGRSGAVNPIMALSTVVGDAQEGSLAQVFRPHLDPLLPLTKLGTLQGPESRVETVFSHRPLPPDAIFRRFARLVEEEWEIDERRGEPGAAEKLAFLRGGGFLDAPVSFYELRDLPDALYEVPLDDDPVHRDRIIHLFSYAGDTSPDRVAASAGSDGTGWPAPWLDALLSGERGAFLDRTHALMSAAERGLSSAPEARRGGPPTDCEAHSDAAVKADASTLHFMDIDYIPGRSCWAWNDVAVDHPPTDDAWISGGFQPLESALRELSPAREPADFSSYMADLLGLPVDLRRYLTSNLIYVGYIPPGGSPTQESVFHVFPMYPRSKENFKLTERPWYRDAEHIRAGRLFPRFFNHGRGCALSGPYADWEGGEGGPTYVWTYACVLELPEDQARAGARAVFGVALILSPLLP